MKHFHIFPARGTWWLPLLFLVAACSSSLDGGREDRSEAVGFSTRSEWSDARTSSTDNTVSFATGDRMGVFAYHGKTCTDNVRPDFMENQQVSFDGTQWTYSPVKYWPNTPGDYLSFYAYYPWRSAGNDTLRVGHDADTGAPVITYDNLDARTDWCAARAEGVAYAKGKDGVHLGFRHLLARVRFQFTVTGEPDDVDYRPVVHVLKYNVPHVKGTLRFPEGDYNTFRCSTSCEGDSVQIRRVTNDVAGVSVSKEGVVIPEFTAYLFPCKFPCTDDATELGTFTVSLNNVAHTFRPSGFVQVLEPGKSYMVNFNIQPADSSTNFFITSFSLWEDGGSIEDILK